MSSESPIKRRFWQIHLSTAAAMMLLYAALLAVELSFNASIEAHFVKLMKADAITASDVNPTPETPLLPLYLFVNFLAAIAGGLVAEFFIRRGSKP